MKFIFPLHFTPQTVIYEESLPQILRRMEQQCTRPVADVDVAGLVGDASLLMTASLIPDFSSFGNGARHQAFGMVHFLVSPRGL